MEYNDTSLRCSAVVVKDIAGQRFGRLVAIVRLCTPDGYRWLCRCDCGNTTHVRLCNLGRITRSCGCLRVEACRARERLKNHPPYGEVLRYYKRNAKLRGLCWELPRDTFTRLVSSPCSYCGSLPETNNGIDRPDNERGYTVDNAVSCCTRCNQAKNDMTFNQFKEWISKVHTHLIQTGGV